MLGAALISIDSYLKLLFSPNCKLVGYSTDAAKLVVSDTEIRKWRMICPSHSSVICRYLVVYHCLLWNAKNTHTFYSYTPLVCHMPVVNGIPLRLVVCCWLMAVVYENSVSMSVVLHRHLHDQPACSNSYCQTLIDSLASFKYSIFLLLVRFWSPICWFETIKI